ncbi:C4-dicarboxylate ABC transporter [Selenomonas caprae]|jgi:DcuC family C4-dicarboxylate transporter|uniref:C4-dicarboxylate transporter, DcuC family n=2 Tax=Selenomonas TaxID=970 RepID=A0A1I3HP88_SELRU|nr:MULTISPECIES: C4-dicarboxylate transporter DcuC [Selenomonas]TYZ27029.1 C4-dicarboxylate ABC transporter [Selenomonas caprae]SFI37399.1 C4-dicarboxylate transporter, DcuC family [Selenomonas ruminantium]
MLGLLIALIAVVWVTRLVLKKYPAQPVLFTAGVIMMMLTLVLGLGEILPDKKSTGSAWLDIIQSISLAFSSRAAALGMIIMLIGGFSMYMDKIGASTALVRLAIKPLQKLGHPYLVLALTSILTNVLAMFISSASGFGLLLMVTMYPVLVRLGVSRIAACAVIATASAPGWGPAGADSIYAAELIGMEIVPYFMQYQVPIGIATVLSLAAAHYFVQKYLDRKHPDEMAGKDVSAAITKEQAEAQKSPDVPAFYALLPTLPLVLVLFFGLVDMGVKMDISLATLLSLAITMVIELLRHRDGLIACQGVKAYWDGMGLQMATVVTLVVAAETFSKGLISLGAINTLITGAQDAGFSGIGMMFVFVGIIIAATLVTGSGNAAFFAFVPLAPKVAALSGLAPVLFVLPMNFVSNLARSMSPIAAVMIVVAGAAHLSPMDLAKRTFVPVAIATVVNIGLTLLLFF